MKIGIIGAGRLEYVCICEEAGYDVMVSDIRRNYIEELNQKRIKSNEPLVKDLLSASKDKGYYLKY